MALALIMPVDDLPMVANINTYEQLKANVGGWLEGIYGNGWMAYCDEDGKSKGLPINEEATRLAHDEGWPVGDVLCGTVVFFGPGDDEGNDTNVPGFLLAEAGVA